MSKCDSKDLCKFFLKYNGTLLMDLVVLKIINCFMKLTLIAYPTNTRFSQCYANFEDFSTFLFKPWKLLSVNC
jgi:hypothetical protein